MADGRAVSSPTVEPEVAAEKGDVPYREDPAYAADVVSYTTSLASDYKFENGRRYHAYKEGAYIFPNDEKENNRLDIQHKLMEVAMRNKLYFAPLKDPKEILDIGTGTGIWAMEIGDHFPEATVLGNDLSPIQPRWVPPNVQFEVDDVEDEWTFPKKFDFVHCRTLGNSIKDWPQLLKRCLGHTVPGGYCEFVEYDLEYTSEDGSLREGTPLRVSNKEFIRLTRQLGMEPCPGRSLETWVKEAGFVDVVHEKIVLPMGPWAKDKRLKEIGAWNYLQLDEGLEGFLNYMFSRNLGWSKDQIGILSAQVRQQLKDPKIHTMVFVHVVYGKAPEKPA